MHVLRVRVRRLLALPSFIILFQPSTPITNIRGVARTLLQRIPFCTGTHFPMSPHHFSTIHMGPIPAPARSTFPIDTPNHEHGHYDDDEDIDEEAPTGDTDITAT